MSIEPFIAFYAIRKLQKNLRNFSPDEKWDKVLTLALYGIGALFFFDIFTPFDKVTDWIWHVLILSIIYVAYRFPVFANLRTLIIAILPLVIVSLVSDFLEDFFHSVYLKIDTILDFSLIAAVILMFVLLIQSNKQTKALQKERQKAKEQEERRIFIAAQNEQLEIIVAERTSEITRQKDELEHAITELKATQAQLIHSEKMASLGELTAGIAHEIQNPLNFVNNFSEINYELIEEMKSELSAGNAEEAVSIAENIKENEQKIIHHGKRADAIVKGMLQHSRSSSGQKEPTDINALADEYLRLSYHGLRAKDKSFNSKMETCFDETLDKINVVPQDVGRAFLNLFTNAFYAVSERKKIENNGYMPNVIVSTKKLPGKVQIKVRDNGLGIPEKALDKIFQPFFTTKPSGQGTGLGLSLSFEIITQGHGGEMKVDTKEGEFAEFVIELPAQNISN
ncbi:MAG: ATP-binding protein [Ginsengibacter sp.]